MSYTHDDNIPVFFPGLEEPKMQECLQYLLTTGAYVGDGLAMMSPALNFINEDLNFLDSLEKSSNPLKAKAFMWRIHSACWAAKSCLSVEGDFVECGIEAALIASTIVNYLNFSSIDKSFYLYDSFSGIPENIINNNKEVEALNYARYSDSDLYDKVLSYFIDYPNVKVIKGNLPDILSTHCPNSIAFLSIDLGNLPSSRYTFHSLYEKVNCGGIILIHGYGRDNGYKINELAKDPMIKDLSVLELASGQGVIIKR